MQTSPITIGLFGITTQETANRTLHGLLQYAEETGGFEVRDFRVPPSTSARAWAPPPWRGRADGVVVNLRRIPETTDKETADWLLSGGVPVVNVNAGWRDARIPGFRVECRSLARVAAEHLIACGSRSFLFVGISSVLPASEARRKEFVSALGRHGFEPKTTNVDNDVFGATKQEKSIRGQRQLEVALRRMPKPLGVWTVNDHAARSICHVCTNLGLAVPEQVRVLGVDDLLTARAETPTLSTIHTPGERIGYLALQSLHALLRGERCPPLTEVLATDLVTRESTVSGYRASPELQETLDYIVRHACSGLTVEHLAERLHVSRRSFEMKFREFVGHSPGTEIQRLRLQRAKELLWQTQLSMKHISAVIGFQETACFSKFFRKETGLSPREFRAGARR